MKERVLLVFGTRSEAIKMLPVTRALADEPSIEAKICVTAQHRQMLDQVRDLFEMRPTYDLGIMTQAQGLDQITSAVLNGFSRVIDPRRST